MYKLQSLPGTLVDYTHPLVAGLVGWWPLNEGAGSRSNDIIGNNRGIITGPTWGKGGKIGVGLSFDGSDDYIDNINKGTNNAGMASLFTRGITFSAWIRPTSVAETKILMSNYNGSGQTRGFSFRGGGNIAILYVNPNGGNFIGRQYATAQPVDVWSHLVATWNGVVSNAGFKLYLNGQRVDNADLSGGTVSSYSSTSDEFEIGRARNGAGGLSNFFQGEMSDMRIYNRELSVAEIGQLLVEPFAGLYYPNIKYLIASLQQRVYAFIMG